MNPKHWARALTCAALATTGAHAQGRAGLHPDQRIRFVAPDAGYPNHVAGTVVSVATDSVVVQVRGVQAAIASAALHDVQVSAGRGPRGRWAAVGALAGTGAGAGAAWSISRYSWNEKHYEEVKQCTSDGRCGYYQVLVKTPYPGGRFMAITAGGTVLGTLAGYLLPGDRWRPLSVAARPVAGRRTEVAFSLRR